MYSIFKGFGANISQNPVKIEMPRSVSELDTSLPVGDDELSQLQEEQLVFEPLPDPSELLENAESEAARIIETAKKEMAAERSAFEEELKRTVEAEKQKAYELGLIEGAEKKAQDIENAIAELNAIVGEIKENFNEFIDEQRSDLVTLVLEVTEKILAKRIEADDMIMLPIIQKALQTVKINSHCAIAVSEDASELITFLKSELKKSKNADSAMFDVVAKDMPIDFCMLEVDDSCLDISISSQFENLKNFLKHSE